MLDNELQEAYAHYVKGCQYLTSKKYVDAINEFNISIKLDPEARNAYGKANAYSNKGWALEALGRHEEAINAYDNALKLNPRDVISWNGKGNVLDNLGRHNEAIAQYNTAIRLNERYANAYYNKGLALERLEKYKKAIKAYDMAIGITTLKPSMAFIDSSWSPDPKDLATYRIAKAARDKLIARMKSNQEDKKGFLKEFRNRLQRI